MNARPRIVVLGGGFGGLESAFYLRHRLGEDANLTLVSDQDHFLFKPNTIYIPFGTDPASLKLPLELPTRRKKIRFVQDRVTGIEPEARKVHLKNQALEYDFLIVATGAAMIPAEIPGLAENAVTVWSPEEMLRLRQAMENLLEGAKVGKRAKLLYLIPPNNRCAGPLYEIALMTDTWLRRKGVRDQIEMTWTTYEDGYIQAFGPRLNTVVSQEFEERGISGHKSQFVKEVKPGRAIFTSGEELDYTVLVSFPPYIAGNKYPSLKADERGFIQVDPGTRRVRNQDWVYAVGDAADFPIKQAFLALLQADAAGEQIAAEVLGKSPGIEFEPMSMCVMEELNRATFAQVPLRYTGDPLKPVAAVSAENPEYKVGVSPLWRLGKKVLGVYAPWRFGHGEPFHAGFAWDAMDLGLKVMSKFMAS